MNLQCIDPVKLSITHKLFKKYSRYPFSFTLRDVGHVIKKLVGKYNNEVYMVRYHQFINAEIISYR